MSFSEEEVLKDIQDIRDTVHWIVQNKQDKIRATVIIPFILYLLSQAFLGIWWASDTTRKLDNLTATVLDASKDRYYGKDAKAFERIVELQESNLQLQIDVERGRIDILLADQRVNKNRIDELKETVQECRSKLKSCNIENVK